VASDVNITKKLLEFVNTEIVDFKKSRAEADNGEEYDRYGGVIMGLFLVKNWIEAQ